MFGVSMKPPTKEQYKRHQQIQVAQMALSSTIVACKIGESYDPDGVAQRSVDLAFEIAARFIARSEELGVFEEFTE